MAKLTKKQEGPRRARSTAPSCTRSTDALGIVKEARHRQVR